MKINMGCGWRNFGSDWIHIDGGDYSHLDYHDICDLPFEDSTVDLIYASHVIEYFNRKEVINLLKEWNRVLKAGGVIRLAVPDFRALATLYLTEESFTLDNAIGPLYGQMQMKNNTIYHKTTYDYESLKKILLQSGFDQIKKFDWRITEHSKYDDHSQAYFPHMDKDNGTLVSLNVEGKKSV